MERLPLEILLERQKGRRNRVEDSELEGLFRKISQRTPSKAAFKNLTQCDYKKLVTFLVGKLIQWTDKLSNQQIGDSASEWGIIHSCHLLAKLRAHEACVPMIELLDLVKDSEDSVLFDTLMICLEDMGYSALDSAYDKYLKDKHDYKYGSTWLWVLSSLGVKDKRIHQALIQHMAVDSDEAIHLMGNYGDRTLQPIVNSYVENIVQYLNENRIDPFARNARFEDSLVSAYIDGRESLAILRYNLTVDHPDFDKRVEELDRELLKYADFSVYDKAPGMNNHAKKSEKVGRNSPCPCGSGQKFKKCCGK